MLLLNIHCKLASILLQIYTKDAVVNSSAADFSAIAMLNIMQS